MMFLRMFGIGVSKAAAGAKKEGTVTEVKICYWLKINTKPVRTHAGEGAAYPCVIRFSYQVAGKLYTGKRWVQWNKRCPAKGEKITVYYEEASPERFAVII